MNRGSKRCREGMRQLVARRDDEGRGFVGLTTHQTEQWAIGAPPLWSVSPVMEALAGAVPCNPSGASAWASSVGDRSCHWIRRTPRVRAEIFLVPPREVMKAEPNVIAPMKGALMGNVPGGAPAPDAWTTYAKRSVTLLPTLFSYLAVRGGAPCSMVSIVEPPQLG